MLIKRRRLTIAYAYCFAMVAAGFALLYYKTLVRGAKPTIIASHNTR